jgi:hypothetical protein
LTEIIADRLFAEVDGRVCGAEIVRRDGTRERIGCEALILACNGYGAIPSWYAASYRRWRSIRRRSKSSRTASDSDSPVGFAITASRNPE